MARTAQLQKDEVKAAVRFEAAQMRLETEHTMLKEVLRQSDERQQQLRNRLQEIRADISQAESNKVKLQDLERLLVQTEAQLASTNSQHEVIRSTLQTNRASDPVTASLRGELRNTSQRNAKLQALRESLVKQLQDSEENCHDFRVAEVGTVEKEAPAPTSADPKKEQLADVATQAADLELETQKLKQIRADAEEKTSLHVAKEKHLRQQLVEGDQKLQKAMDLHEAESAACEQRLQDLLLAKQEMINAVQKETDQLLSELQEKQAQHDLTEAEGKELSSSFERSQRTEKQTKKVAARWQSELEDLSQMLSTMQRDRQQLMKETERYRRNCMILVGALASTSTLLVTAMLLL